MEIEKKVDGENMTMAVVGRLDALTSEAFGAEVGGLPEAVKNLVFDFARLDFIASAGLRVIVNAYKLMKGRGGNVRIANANETVQGILKLTGMSAVLDREQRAEG